MSAVIALLLACEATGSDKVAVGEHGWQRLDALAGKEGFSDLKLFQAMRITSDAARRMKKVSLETGLVRRMLAVAYTFGFYRKMEKALRDRLDFLQRKQAEVAASLLEAHFAAGR